MPAALDEITALGAAIGRQLAAAFAAQRANPDDRRQALAAEADGIEDVEDALRPIEQSEPGAGSDLAYAFRAFAIQQLARGQAFTDAIDRGEAQA